MAEVEKVEKAPKVEKAYFRNPVYAGVVIQVQKLVKNVKTGEDEQQLDEQVKFTQYYDTHKGDVIRVGYAEVSSPKLIEACRSDEFCEEISEKEYKLALEGDAKTKPLTKAPVPAE